MLDILTNNYVLQYNYDPQGDLVSLMTPDTWLNLKIEFSNKIR